MDASWSLFERQMYAARKWLTESKVHGATMDNQRVMRIVDLHYPGGYERFLDDHGLAGKRPR